LIAIDSHPIGDILDYRFFLTEETILLSLRRQDKAFEVTISKERYADIGLEFETFLMDRKRSCANRCIFCFIDQNPCGMRETVYFKDDDTRLSFLMGNYVTLTNVSEKELNRIVSMRLSPVNVSVHTTNPALRVKMLGNPHAAKIMDQLRILKNGGIDLNCQIVACRGINDGAELERSIRELETLMPSLQSIAVVPAGLTAHRKGLYPLSSYDPRSAKELIALVERLGAEYEEKYGIRLVYAADEFYLAASLPIPPEEYYDGYPQLDNGVGMLRSSEEDFFFEWNRRLEEGLWDHLPDTPLDICLATGMAAEGLIRKICQAIMEKMPSIRLRVTPIPNRFFGESVTVAGLICGSDLIETVRPYSPSILFLPAVCLRHERDRFLDDLTPEDAEREIGCPIYCMESVTDILDRIEILLNGR
jgi:putative radical SAM enzyme (TIGR03279 family)